MKAWLPALAGRLAENPVLALASARNMARAAVFGRDGELWAGGLFSASLQAAAAEEAKTMAPGECRLVAEPGPLTLECLPAEGEGAAFWRKAAESQEGAWASWLLTMPVIENGTVKIARHLLSAFGPWTTPRLPAEMAGQWSLLPLKAGLGRLLVLGDDALALETAALAARAGLSVTYASAVEPDGPDLAEAQSLGDFDCHRVASWPAVDLEALRGLGLREGVRVLVTTAHCEGFLPALQESRLRWLGLAGEAEGCAPGAPSGLFGQALTVSQKALGLIAQMLA